MINYIQPGNTLSLAPGANVASGVGYLFGTALFGVAAQDVSSGVAGPFINSGIVTIGKTSALAIAIGDVLYWDATNKVVNKTTSGQRAVGIAVSAADNPSSTVEMRIGVKSLVGT